MSHGVLALDLSTRTGWAYGRLPAHPMTQMEAAIAKPLQPVSGIHLIAPFGTPVGPFLAAFRSWLVGMVVLYSPAGVIFEAPILPRKTNPATVRKLTGLCGITQMTASERGITWVREAQPSSVKLHICGDGGPGKEGVMRAIQDRGWHFASDDEADALALLDYAAHLAALERAAA